MQIDIGEWQVRSFDDGDAASLAKYANNPAISRNLRDVFPYPYTLSDARQWIEIATHQLPETNFAIASATEVIGGIGFTLQQDVYRRSAKIGYWLGEPFWRLGIAKAALQAVSEYAFNQHDLVRLDAHVFEWNPASARVLEKVGYVCEGRHRKSVSKDGQIADQFTYAKVRE